MINRILAASAATFLLAVSLHGQNAPKPEKPIIATEIESTRLQVQNDGDKAYFHFTEGVVLTATNMRVECDSLEVFATREFQEQSNIGKFSAIKEIIASGNVKIVQEERTATCQKAVVQPNEERIVLSGNPVVTQPSGRIVTYNPEDEIVLDRGNGRISINTKGPRKLRLTSSAISDLGFESDSPIPTSGADLQSDSDEEQADPADEPADSDRNETETESGQEAPDPSKN